jgi:hypothetical protein
MSPEEVVESLQLTPGKVFHALIRTRAFALASRFGKLEKRQRKALAAAKKAGRSAPAPSGVRS